jgi:hypothetical protein
MTKAPPILYSVQALGVVVTQRQMFCSRIRETAPRTADRDQDGSGNLLAAEVDQPLVASNSPTSDRPLAFLDTPAPSPEPPRLRADLICKRARAGRTVIERAMAN